MAYKPLDSLNIPLVGTNLIEASAGTGKTFTITTLFIRLILAGHHVDKILIVTFTNAATAELRERIRDRLKEVLDALDIGSSKDELCRSILADPPYDARKRIRQALSNFDQAVIFTIHGFCKSMLRDYAFESSVFFDLDIEPDITPMLHEIASDYWSQALHQEDRIFVRHVMERIKRPERLTSLMKTAISQPDLKIIPETTKQTIDYTSFNNLFAQLKDIFEQQGLIIKNLLLSQPSIFKVQPLKKLHWALLKTEAYLRTGQPARILYDDTSIGYLTPKNLEKCVYKEHLSQTPQHEFFEICQAFCEENEQILMFLENRLTHLKREAIDYAKTELADRKNYLDIQFYDDLLQDLDRALMKHGGQDLANKISSRFDAALIDEFQDTDRIQYRIFHTIFQQSGKVFFMIGDPKQSIYGFRGADIFAYLKAVENSGDQTHTLLTNYRSDPALIKAINSFYEGIPNPFLSEKIQYFETEHRPGAYNAVRIKGQETAGLHIVRLPELYHDQMIASEISRLFMENTTICDPEERKVVPEDIAVLVRDRYQAYRLKDALSDYNIPSSLCIDLSVFDSYEALELDRFLSTVVSSGSGDFSGGMSAALSTSLIGLDGHQIAAIQENGTEFERWMYIFRQWRDIWLEKGFSAFMEHFGAWVDGGNRKLTARILALPMGTRRLTNFRHLTELLITMEADRHLGMNALLQWFNKQRGQYAPRQENQELQMENDRNAVKLVTIHKSKGLEYPIVFLPYFHDMRVKLKKEGDILAVSFHDPDNDYQPVFDLGSDQFGENYHIAWKEGMAENLRLLYVALTRARHLCIAFTREKVSLQSPLEFCIHHPRLDKDLKWILSEYLDNKEPEELEAIYEQNYENLLKRSEGTITVRDFDFIKDYQFDSDGVEIEELSAKQIIRKPQSNWLISSYSGLASKVRQLGPAEDEGLDHDDVALEEVEEEGVDEIESEKSVAEEIDGDGDRILLADFKKGPRAGNFIHSIFEECDFTATDTELFEKILQTKLEFFRLDTPRWFVPIKTAIIDVLNTPLDEQVDNLSLKNIASAHRLNELKFFFPVANGLSGGGKALTGLSLSKLFMEYAGTSVPQTYSHSLRQLSFPPLRGFLKGYIDLIFEHNGCYSIVDYKSNYLGELYGDYRSDKLTTAMVVHNYILQYHIYTVALHRYLSYRLKDYEYNRHFGKVYYLFVRGMAPHRGPEFGIYRSRPPFELIQRLSALISGDDEGGLR